MSERERYGDQAGSLRIVCDPGHTQGMPSCNCDRMHILGDWKFQTSWGLGRHNFLIFLVATRTLSSNNICPPFQNIHTCSRREVRNWQSCPSELNTVWDSNLCTLRQIMCCRFKRQLNLMHMEQATGGRLGANPFNAAQIYKNYLGACRLWRGA